MSASHTIESSNRSGGGPLEVATAKRWFLGLRRTAVVWLAEGGCTEGEIAAISGHDIETVRTILETYLPRTGKMAASAIAKLEDARRRRDDNTNEQARGGVIAVRARRPIMHVGPGSFIVARRATPEPESGARGEADVVCGEPIRRL